MLFYPSEREKGKKGGKRGREKGEKEEGRECRHNAVDNAQRAYEYYRMPWYINSCRRF